MLTCRGGSDLTWLAWLRQAPAAPITAAIVLWNTVYLQRAVQALWAHGQPVDEALLPYLSPLGCEPINLTGDYSWRSKRAPGKFQPLRPLSRP